MLTETNSYAGEYHFKNGYGASVVRNTISGGNRKGLFELAVLRLTLGTWDLFYTTPITSSVVGWLTQNQVDALLVEIESL